MARKKDTVDLIEALVNSLTPSLSITTNTDNGDGTFTLEIPNTYWLAANKRITINLIEYRIIELTINDSIKIKPTTTGDPAPSVSIFPIAAPNFLHGVLQMASIKQQKPKDPNLRTPFVYLYEVLEETEINDEFNPWGLSSKPRLYFMDESKTDWDAPQHKQNVIEPVGQMVDLFFEKIDDDPGKYKEVLEKQKFQRADWGKFVAEKGNIEKLFSDTISGIEVGFDFTASKPECDAIIGGITCDITVIVSTAPESVSGEDDGTASAAIEGEQGVVAFAWVGPNGYTSEDQNITGLAPGEYTVTVTDSVILNPPCTAISSGVVEEGEADLNGLKFEVNDYVDIGNPTELMFSGDMSVSCWIKPNLLTGFQTIIADSDDGSATGWKLEINFVAGKLSILTNVTRVLQGSTTLDVTNIYNVIITRKFNGVSDWDYHMYLNNIAEGATLGNTQTPAAPAHIAIGRLGSVNAHYFDGLLKGVALFDKVLTSGDRAAILSEGEHGDVATLGISNLQGFYPQNAVGSTAISEETVNGNEGTLTNFIFTPSPWVPFVAG